MLPFMHKDKIKAAGTMVIARKPDEDKPESPDAGIEAAATDLINAIHAKDTRAVVMAIKAIFQLMDSTEESMPLESEQE